MSEEQAHRYLQKKSMDSGARLTQTAQLVLDGTQHEIDGRDKAVSRRQSGVRPPLFSPERSDEA